MPASHIFNPYIELIFVLQIGNVTGLSSWQQAGQEEHAKGETEITAAKAHGYTKGTSDVITGYKDSVVGAVTGDKAQQVSGMHRFFVLLPP